MIQAFIPRLEMFLSKMPELHVRMIVVTFPAVHLPLTMKCFRWKNVLVACLRHLQILNNMLSNLANDFLNDSVTDWLSDSLTHRQTNWLADWSIGQPTERPTDKLSNFTNWLATNWLTDRLNEWTIDRLNYWIYHDWLTGHQNKDVRIKVAYAHYRI